MKKKVYIAGKITGDPEYRKKFLWKRILLEAEGCIVLNPAELPGGMEQKDYMRICFAMMEVADEVWFLPDWKDSKGATLEHAWCEYTGKTMRFDHEEAQEECAGEQCSPLQKAFRELRKVFGGVNCG